MNLKPEDRELVELRREYKNLLMQVSTTLRDTTQAMQARKTLGEVEKKLATRGDTAFIASSKAAREQAHSFFGDFDTTARGRAFQLARSPRDLGRGLFDTIKEDAVDLLVGRGAAYAAQGLVKNSRFARALGAEKFIDPDAFSPTASNDSVRGGGKGKQETVLLEKIEKNTRGFLDAFITDQQGLKRAANENSIENRLSTSVPIVPRASISDQDNEIKKEDDDSTFGDVGKIAAGTALGGVISKTISKGLMATRLAGIAGTMLWAGMDAAAGWIEAEKWETSKVAGAIGAAVGGFEGGLQGAFMNSGKFAIAGATIGAVGGPAGIIAGGIAGAAIGGLAGFFGGEKIAKSIQSAMDGMEGWFTENFKAVTVDKLKEKLKDLQRPSGIDELTKELASVNEELTRAMSENDQQAIKSLQDRRDQIKSRLITAAALNEEHQQKVRAAEKELEEVARASTGTELDLLAREKDWIKRTFSDNILKLFDTVFGVDSEEKNREKIKFNEEALVRVKERADKVAEEITQTIATIREAEAAGDEKLATTYRNRLNSLYRHQDEIKKDGEIAQANIDTVLNTINGVSKTMAEKMGLNSAMFEDARVKTSAAMEDFIKKAADWVSKIFTWDYWFGEANKKSEGVKENVKKSRFVSQLESNSTNLIDNREDTEVKNALAMYREDRINEDQLKTMLEEIKARATGKTKTGIESSLRDLSAFKAEQLKTDIRSPAQEEINRMTLANANQDRTEMERESRRGQGLSSIAQMIDNRTVNNNSTTVMSISPHNSEPSFLTGVFGTRSQAFAY